MLKRGVSPLIATVLLIAFAVALGAVVMNWGKSYVEDTAMNVGKKSDTALTCTQDVDLNILEINDQLKICFNGTGLEFILENRGIRQIDGIRIIAFDDSDDINVSDLSTLTISAGGVKRGGADSHLGNISHVEFIPMLKDSDGVNFNLCTNSKLVLEDIGSCS